MRHCLRITQQPTLLEDNAALARTIRNRFPYLDPLNHLQVELLRPLPCGGHGRAHPAHDPPYNKRVGGGVAQHRLTLDRREAPGPRPRAWLARGGPRAPSRNRSGRCETARGG